MIPAMVKRASPALHLTRSGPCLEIWHTERLAVGFTARRAGEIAGFELPAAVPVGGVVLLHRLSDSPYGLRALGEAC